MKSKNSNIQDVINQFAADTFLSSGSYEDLELAADGDEEAAERIMVWESFQYWEYNRILESVNNLAENTIELFEQLKNKI